MRNRAQHGEVERLAGRAGALGFARPRFHQHVRCEGRDRIAVIGVGEEVFLPAFQRPVDVPRIVDLGIERVGLVAVRNVEGVQGGLQDDGVGQLLPREMHEAVTALIAGLVNDRNSGSLETRARPGG